MGAFEEFWRRTEKDITARCYVDGQWLSPHAIAQAVFEALQSNQAREGFVSDASHQ